MEGRRAVSYWPEVVAEGLANWVVCRALPSFLYMMQDEPRQSAQASKLMESLSSENPGFVTVVSVVELAWVLGGCYALDRGQIADAIDGLLRTQEIVIERAEVVWKAAPTARGLVTERNKNRKAQVEQVRVLRVEAVGGPAQGDAAPAQAEAQRLM